MGLNVARVFRWILFGVSVVACVALGYAAFLLAGASWDAVVDYQSPYVDAAGGGVRAPGSAVAFRTVLVIIDGLREDSSLEMTTMERLRTYGSSVSLVAPQPSLSYPNWTTILSGAPPYVSGVVTNWHEGVAPVETLFDTAKKAGLRTVFVGPTDFEQLYGVESKTTASYMKEWNERYMSAEYVDAALRLAAEHDPELLVIHFPDVDEAGHAYGGDSDEYANAAARVDADLRVLVEGFLDEQTAFVVVTDHGHIGSGGHGGWEDEVVTVPAVIVGPGVALGRSEGRLEDVASTVALFAGIAPPSSSTGRPLAPVVADASAAALEPARATRNGFVERFVEVTSGEMEVPVEFGDGNASHEEMDRAVSFYSTERLSADRRERLYTALAGVAVAVLALGLVLLASRPAFWSALAGTAAYYAVYNGLFFVVHRYRWSLSAFNSEDLIDTWMNLRLGEAAASMFVGVAVAALVYPFIRRNPKGPREEYLAGWLTLGPATVLVTLATLGIQVAWFYWAWGIDPVWRLPDLRWGFKYDLDLIQATAIGFVALLTPLVTWAVGRYHPRTRRRRPDQEGPEAGAPVPSKPLVPAGTGSAAEER